MVARRRSAYPIASYGAYVAAVGGAVVLWEAAVTAGWISSAALAAPSEVPGGAARLVEDGSFLRHDLRSTVSRTLLGVAIGYPAGVLVAAAIVGAGAARPLATRTLDFVRSIPITALLPIFITLFGLGDPSKVAIGALSAGAVTAVAALEGLRASFARHEALLRLYAPSLLDRWLRVGLPYAAPSLLAGLRLAVSSALVLVVVAEMFIGTRHGVGKVINDLTYTDDRPQQVAAVVVIGAIGFVLNLAMDRVSRRVLRRVVPVEAPAGHR